MSAPTQVPDRRILEAVNGVILPGFFGTDLPQWLAEALDDGLAGVVYFGQNISPDTARLSAAIRSRRPSAIIAADEEGGTVTRLEAEHGSTLPGPAQLGQAGDMGLSTSVGAALAVRAAAAGINLVLGPVADVNTNPANPVIGVRSFGAEPRGVAAHVAAAVRGIQASGAVAACAKHFPGHGDTHTDSHLALPELRLATGEIEEIHFEPFRAAVSAGVRAVMTAHIRVPGWGDAPATLNPVILGKLRAIGFSGVIVTDALDMAAIREGIGMGAGAVAAIRAGADLLCIGNPRTNPGNTDEAGADCQDYLVVRNALLAAVASGELFLEQLEQAAARVRTLAADLEPSRDLAMTETAEPDWAAGAAPGIDVSGTVARSAGRLALVDLRARATLAVAAESDAFRRAFASRRAVLALLPVTAPQAWADNLRGLEPDADVIVLVDRIGVPGPQRDALEEIAALRPDAVVVNVGVAPEPGFANRLDRIDARASSALSAGIVAGLVYGEASA
ncbi:glycoside hydrolase family 3 protein [Arthrobacter gandavensis]|uniref:glycoside hydrolase family 3 N-terminal domain-containing protein n=1 Tax=Arthrobacter gandavensis TaxID=169960 RepID=UPI00188DD9BE|nr:glycoside hydrolase family 3 N-terminal domain-containing protein [Arthrobacter gandavensis]MBF4992918.1 glycoside hydrolase family 3 protein [Arthrobacter gandavensis]